MGLIDSVIKEPQPAAPKGIVYGPPGIGKTTFGASAPNSIILDCENGAGAVQCARTPYLQTWPEILAWLTELEHGGHGYGTVAVDSLDWLLRRIEEHVTGGGRSIEQTLHKSHGGYGNGRLVMRNVVYQHLLPVLDRLVVRGIAVVLLAHANRQTIVDIDGIASEKVTCEVPSGYLNVLVEWSDFVCLARLDADGNRVLVCRETARALAKNRYGLPDVVPMDWASFSAAIAEGMNRQLGA